MVVKATPPSPFIVIKPEFLLEVLIVPLNPPAQLGGVHQGTLADIGGQRGQEVFCRLGFVGGPFDQAPFFGPRRGAFIIAMCGADAQDSPHSQMAPNIPANTC